MRVLLSLLIACFLIRFQVGCKESTPPPGGSGGGNNHPPLEESPPEGAGWQPPGLC